MSYIVVENVSKTYAVKTLLDKVGFSINKGEKIALVAKNGSGKSTLLKILAEKEIADTGNITRQRGIRLAYLEQEPTLDPEKTLQQEIFSTDSILMSAVKRYEESLENPSDERKMQAAFDDMNKYNAWGYEEQITEILTNLNLVNLEGKIFTFSGGQKKRLALAKILLDSFELIIMDEPTNHLDLDMINWLEDYLSHKDLTLLLVTHDRYFLDKVCNTILELDSGKIYKHAGNYEYYLTMKNTRQMLENVNIEKTKLFLKKEVEWIKRQPQGRQTKATARVDAFYQTQANLKPKNITKNVELDIIGKRMGNRILELHNLTKSYGERIILNKFNYEFNKGEKIGIIGNNGVGKTTFLNLIRGIEPADSGKITTGQTVSFGYYSQEQTELTGSLRVIEAVTEIAENIKLSNGLIISAAKMLERFLFSANDQQNLVANLSGGEKKRLSLLRILMKSPNFLILDEPTNDFDLMTLDVLEEFLRNFQGCLIIISHDRYFMDRIIDHLFVFQGQGVIVDFVGNYSDYRRYLEIQPAESAQLTQPKITKTADNNIAKKELKELLSDIKKLEKKKTTLNEELYLPGKNHVESITTTKQIKDLQIQIDEKTQLWLEKSS